MAPNRGSKWGPGNTRLLAESFGTRDPRARGCDSSVQFPPHGLSGGFINSAVPGLAKSFAGLIRDYKAVVKAEISSSHPAYLRFRTVMPSWDNTPRRGRFGT